MAREKNLQRKPTILAQRRKGKGGEKLSPLFSRRKKKKEARREGEEGVRGSITSTSEREKRATSE